MRRSTSASGTARRTRDVRHRLAAVPALARGALLQNVRPAGDGRRDRRRVGMRSAAARSSHGRRKRSRCASPSMAATSTSTLPTRRGASCASPRAAGRSSRTRRSSSCAARACSRCRRRPRREHRPLRPLLNVTTRSHFVLMVGWLLGALHPRGPYPAAVRQRRARQRQVDRDEDAPHADRPEQGDGAIAAARRARPDDPGVQLVGLRLRQHLRDAAVGVRRAVLPRDRRRLRHAQAAHRRRGDALRRQAAGDAQRHRRGRDEGGPARPHDPDHARRRSATKCAATEEEVWADVRRRRAGDPRARCSTPRAARWRTSRREAGACRAWPTSRSGSSPPSRSSAGRRARSSTPTPATARVRRGGDGAVADRRRGPPADGSLRDGPVERHGRRAARRR
jgi:hypothetical protein